jgi:hypothetical protein
VLLVIMQIKVDARMVHSKAMFGPVQGIPRTQRLLYCAQLQQGVLLLVVLRC